MSDEQQKPVKSLPFYLAFPIIILFTVGVYQLTKMTFNEGVVGDLQESGETPEMRKRIAIEDHVLSQMQTYTTNEDGQVTIPVERAKELVLQRYQ